MKAITVYQTDTIKVQQVDKDRFYIIDKGDKTNTGYYSAINMAKYLKSLEDATNNYDDLSATKGLV